MAGKAYLDGNIRQLIESRGGEVAIPSKSNAKEPHDYDELIYRLRHLIETCFQRLKVFRCVACVLIWLR